MKDNFIKDVIQYLYIWWGYHIYTKIKLIEWVMIISIIITH